MSTQFVQPSVTAMERGIRTDGGDRQWKDDVAWNFRELIYLAYKI
jgi:hypothetical protein